MRQKCFSVTLDDCRVDTFTVGGHGGSGKDTSNTGVRITHLASSAVGKASDSRSQLGNKRLAWRRMAESKAFQAWARLMVAKLSGQPSVESRVEADMAPNLLRIEMQSGNGTWVPYKEDR